MLGRELQTHGAHDLKQWAPITVEITYYPEMWSRSRDGLET